MYVVSFNLPFGHVDFGLDNNIIQLVRAIPAFRDIAIVDGQRE